MFGTINPADTRRQNLRYLVEQYGQSVVAKAVGKPDRQIADILAARKSFGEKVARSMEANWLKARGEHIDLDSPGMVRDMGEASPSMRGGFMVSEPVASYGDELTIPIANASASMGYGRQAVEYDQVVDFMRVTRTWLQTRLPAVTSVENLAILAAYGDSMEPTFADGDLVLVDRGINEIKPDAVYVLWRDDNLFIKRVRRRLEDGALMIQSDNQLYGPPERVENGARAALQVLGRVVWAWRGKKL